MSFRRLKDKFALAARSALVSAAILVEEVKCSLRERFPSQGRDRVMTKFPAAFGLAIRNADAGALRGLLKKDPDLVKPRGRRLIDSPLHAAVMAGQPESLSVLKFFGADIRESAVTPDQLLPGMHGRPAGETALQFARRYSRYLQTLDQRSETSLTLRAGVSECLRLLKMWDMAAVPWQRADPRVYLH